MNRRDFWKTLAGGAAAGFQAANMPAAAALPAETVQALIVKPWPDLRTLITENAVRDTLWEIDKEFLAKVDKIVKT